jgi:hypothetical protein
MFNRLAWVILVCAAFILGCKKTPEVVPTPTVTDSFELLQQKILTPSCGYSGCHKSTADNAFNQHKLVLVGSDVHTRLINGTVANAQAIAAGLKQIVPNDTASSFLYQKLIYAQSRHKYGNLMPLGADALSAKQIEFVRQWILKGAPKTGDVADKTLLN